MRHALIGSLLAVGVVLVLVTGALASPSSSSGGSGKAAYNAIPSKVAQNVPSIGFEAYSTAELGDYVALEGKGRNLVSMSVLFSSWGCESGNWFNADCETTPGATFGVPVTFTIYDYTGNEQGAVLASTTQTVDFAYRPSTSDKCADGQWYNSKDKTCYNGLPQLVTLAFDSGVTLPDQVIWSVKYNTTHFGPNPIGEGAACYTESGGCGYDSLNIGVHSFSNAPFSGVDLDEDRIFIDSSYLDATGWEGYRPLGAISAN